MSGVTGFDYTALPIVEQRVGIKRQARAATFADLQVMENAALDALAKR